MSISRRTIGRSLALLMPSALLVCSAVSAQTAVPTATPANDTATITVNGKRSASGDKTLIDNAKSKVLNRNFASSCNFMSAFSAADDSVTQNYMKDFGLEDSASNDAERFRESAPGGDVSSIKDSSSIETEELPVADPAAGACVGADKNAASARNRIARKDTTFAEGFAAFDNKDYAGARKLFTTAYDKVGYPEAALMLARMHLYGLGTPQNTPEALKWISKVSEGRFDPTADRFVYNPEEPATTDNRVESFLTLAKIYLQGIGTPKSPAEAKKWYAKAADAGFIPANNTLGQAYLNGYGGQQDSKKALAYFTTAAEEGYAPAQYNLAKMYYNGADGVPKDLKKAGAWFSAAAKTGHGGALFAAGRMYDLGEGVPVDQERAIRYYKEASLKSVPGAQSALATYFYNGQLVAKDLPTARKLFSAAAKRGQPDAMFNLAVMNARGEGGEKNPMMAYVWMSLARDAGHESAAAALKAIKPLVSAQDLEKADAILKPKAKS